MARTVETPPNHLLSIREVAARLGITPRSIWNLIADTELPKPLRVGGARRFKPDDIEDYIRRLDARRGQGAAHE